MGNLALAAMFASVLVVPTWASAQACLHEPRAPRLDHVIIAAGDLDALTGRFANEGFRIKNGRPHANGLLNKHVKFRDGTEIELMTVRGEPTDRMSREYAALIAEGDGGAYVALRVESLDSAEAVANRLSLGPRRSSAGPWQFLSFEPRSPLGAVFFIAGGVPAVDPDSIFDHALQGARLAGAHVSAGKQILPLLGALGAGICPEPTVRSGHDESRTVQLSNGILVIFEPVRGFPRPSSAMLRSSPPDSARLTRILTNFVLVYQ